MDLLPIAGARVAQILRIERLVGLPPPSSPGLIAPTAEPLYWWH
jgi:hypothetical protein